MVQQLPFDEMDADRREMEREDRIWCVRDWPTSTTSMRFFNYIGELLERMRAALEDTIIDVRGPHEGNEEDAELRECLRN